MNPPVALSIAGSDPSGGAGIQADLKAFAAMGAYGACVITALTAQNTLGVTAVHTPPVAFLDEQLDAVLSDLPIGAVKTGMLANAAIVTAVATRAAAGHLPNLVVDPVMVATSGTRLLDVDAESAYLDLLFPNALIVTPNAHEAALLVGHSVKTVDDLADAARELHRRGPRIVVVKGGDLTAGEGTSGQAIDAVFDGKRLTLLRAERVPTRNSHGTGCTFSAAIAARLAAGADPHTALAEAKAYVTAALRSGATWRLGGGRGPVDHFPPTDSLLHLDPRNP